MLKITDAVRDILFASDIALEALRQGVLNLSAYAEQIVPEVEKRTWKSVKKSSIVVSLSRIAEELENITPLKPTVHLESLSLKSPLSDITFEKTERTLELSHSLAQTLHPSESQFLTITEGIHEITVILSSELEANVLEHFHVQPKSAYRDLVGISVQFNDTYLPQPNVIYAIIAKLAEKRINLVEIVSTYTELTMVVEKADLEVAVAQLNTLFK